MPQEGQGDKKLRTMAMTYEATQDDADTFMVVMGSIAENFRGVTLVDYQDDSIFDEEERADIALTLHRMRSKGGHLTEEQQAELDSFTRTINEWTGDDIG